MKLAVSSWYPYQHQATALEQLVGPTLFERVPLERASSSVHDAAMGPYLVLLDESSSVPMVGVPAIVEALSRKYPDRGFLPRDAIARARVRALAAKIEECFSRYCVADISAHAGFGRRIWSTGSEASVRVLDDVPKRLEALERYQEGATSRFLVGDGPTLADCLLAALWWTAEDQRQADVPGRNAWLAKWYQRNCVGSPFCRADD
jgi:glutathione S-transferase